MKVFITGSTTGLGELAGQMLMNEGHDVVLHARNLTSKMSEKVPYVVGDLSRKEDILSVAEQVNKLGVFDSIVHNAGVYNAKADEIFTVNVLAPFMLTNLIHRPKRLIYLSSGMHLGGHVNLDRINNLTYSDSKLYVLMLVKYFARNFKDCYINAVDPGWVPTRMGGAGAPDSLTKGAETQAWLSVSHDSSALVTGKYFHHKEQRKYNPEADSVELQNDLVKLLEKEAETST